jgi:hypothetical protein
MGESEIKMGEGNIDCIRLTELCRFRIRNSGLQTFSNLRAQNVCLVPVSLNVGLNGNAYCL